MASVAAVKRAAGANFILLRDMRFDLLSELGQAGTSSPHTAGQFYLVFHFAAIEAVFSNGRAIGGGVKDE